METDAIAQVMIDDAERLCVTPAAQSFTMIYRAAIEVHWDNNLRCLYSPKPREWNYLQWFRHIITGVESECGCSLKLKSETQWKSVPPELQADIEKWMEGRAEPSTPGYRR